MVFQLIPKLEFYASCEVHIDISATAKTVYI